MKRLVLFICTLLCASVLSAQTFYDDSDAYYVLRYEITSTNPPEVKLDLYTNGGVVDVDIPATVYNNGVAYSVTAIGEGSFQNSLSMVSVSIPSSVREICPSAFINCISLSSITMANGVTTIGQAALSTLPSLTSIEIPSSVTYIDLVAFASCNNLMSVKCLGTTPPVLGASVFYSTPAEKTLIVPCGCSEAYVNSDWNDSFATIEEDCTALKDVEEAEYSFYPNPTNSKITFNAMFEKVEVIDLTGKCVLMFSNVKEINIEALSEGTYYLILHNSDKAIMRKVIKK